MNIFMWVLAGVAAGWITSLTLRLHAASCLVVSTIIALVGIIFGGSAMAPAIGGGFGAALLSPFAVLVASVAAIACLRIAGMVYRHFQATAMEQRTAHKTHEQAAARVL